MSPHQETQLIGFPEGFVERLRVHIPRGQNIELDGAIRRRQFQRVLQQLESAKRLTIDPTQILMLIYQLIYGSVVQGFPNKEGLYILDRIVRSAKLTELYNELHHHTRHLPSSGAKR